MSDNLLVRRDVSFYLHDWLCISSIAEADTIDAFIDLSEKLAEDRFLTHYKQSDVTEPSLGPSGVHILPEISQALAQYAELGFFSAGFPEDIGGLGLPFLACSVSFAYFAAANIATSAYPMLTVANARLIATFGTPSQIEKFAKPQIAGRWFGTMCLSEPQAGSNLADIRTKAVAEGVDEFGHRFLISGNKMWISGGDQDASENIVHLVLAKIPDTDGKLPEGTKGLSLFIVPKILPEGRRNDVVVAGLNHKMGYRGTANCLLNFGESQGAVGWLIGEPGQGLRQMFVMMNEARVNVGLGAAALGYRSYRLSVDYARDRVQGRKIGCRDEGSVAIIEHPDVKLMLLAQKAYVEGALALCLYSALLVDKGEDEESSALLGLLTPVTKTWSSEFCLAANDLAIQIHGGYGYTRDFSVEQLLRDNRLNAIHEGTTGIQAIDLLGRKLLRDGSALAILRRRVRQTVERAGISEQLSPFSTQLISVWDQLALALSELRSCAAVSAYNNATPFLRAFGHGVVAWLWLDQAAVAVSSSAPGIDEKNFISGKAAACRYFFEYEVPRVSAWLAPIFNRSDLIASISSDVF